MIKSLKVPLLEDAIQLLEEAEKRNPGPWVQHSIYVAKGAEIIASHHPSLDPTTAYILGCLHDIGRREGVTDLRHTIDGYTYLSSKSYDDSARICITHSFPIKNIYAGQGKWDCSQDELDFIEDFLNHAEFTDYDRLIQLCDCLALPSGFCLIEKRMVDVTLRRGVNDLTIDKWKAFFSIKEEFERVIGQSIYLILPGVVNNTFGLNLTDG